MKTSNVSEKFQFPASMLLGGEFSVKAEIKAALLESDPSIAPELLEVDAKDLLETYVKVSKLLAEADLTKEEKESNRKHLHGLLTKKTQKLLTSLGVVLPVDRVEVEVNLGTLVFDLYTANAQAPTAPLAIAKHNAKVQSLALNAEKEELDISEEVLEVVKKPLEDEEKWLSTSFSGIVTINGQKNYLQLNSKASGFYPKVMAALMKLYGVNVNGTSEAV